VSMIAIEVAPGPLRAISVLPDGVMFTREGKLARKATGYEREKAEAALSDIGSRVAQPEFPTQIGAYR